MIHLCQPKLSDKNRQKPTKVKISTIKGTIKLLFDLFGLLLSLFDKSGSDLIYPESCFVHLKCQAHSEVYDQASDALGSDNRKLSDLSSLSRQESIDCNDDHECNYRAANALNKHRDHLLWSKFLVPAIYEQQEYHLQEIGK